MFMRFAKVEILRHFRLAMGLGTFNASEYTLTEVGRLLAGVDIVGKRGGRLLPTRPSRGRNLFARFTALPSNNRT